MLPRIEDFVEGTQDRDKYKSKIEELRRKAVSENAYWTLDSKLRTTEEVEAFCREIPTVVISEKWKLVGIRTDIIMLAKLSGDKLQGNEEYWTKILDLLKPEQKVNKGSSGGLGDLLIIPDTWKEREVSVTPIKK